MTWADLVSQKARVRRTDFAASGESDPAPRVVRVRTGGPGRAPRHQQAASIHRHTCGDLLIACRWDAIGSDEGDASNEQALYVSGDGGGTWSLANGGRPAITLDHGSGFDRPSAITHAFVAEHGGGRTWLYYTVNQPHTWGRDRPDRATGGGEIRRLELRRVHGTWLAEPVSEVVWGYRTPVPDGRGGTWDDVRMLCLNGTLRLRDGRLVMPVAGRATVDDPDGAFWRLDRCWVLRSDDDGATWRDCRFVAGSEALCLCEPTIVEAAADGHLVALMRAQYDTGRELYRSESRDGGDTWTAPVPTGLPNAAGFGVKPYLTRLTCGAYALLQTNEHDTCERTNVALFVTDEEGLVADRWPVVRVVGSESERGWLGSMYGWIAEGEAGVLHCAWVSYHRGLNHLNYACLDPAWAASAVVEAVAPNDADGDDRPRFDGAAPGWRFGNTRARAHVTRPLASAGPDWSIDLDARIDRAPVNSDLQLLDLRTRSGADVACRVALRPAHGGRIWLDANQGWTDTGYAPRMGEAFRIELTVRGDKRVTLAITDGSGMAAGLATDAFLKTALPVTTVNLGGSPHPEACAWFVIRVEVTPDGQG